MIYSVISNKDFSTALHDVEKSLMDAGFGVLWKLNFRDKLNEKGLDFHTNFMILEVCNPQKAKKVLDTNIDIGYFLPCKVAVYEKENQVIIGMARPTAFISKMGDHSLTLDAEDVEGILKRAIDGAS